jgi:hypothetical protein
MLLRFFGGAPRGLTCRGRRFSQISLKGNPIGSLLTR